ncbi:MAG: family 43 glycosylhydrolase [Chloroflexota bacterium]
MQQSTPTQSVIEAGTSSFTISQTIENQTVQRPVNIRAPQSIASGKQYPVVFVFHGNGGIGSEYLDEGRLNALIDQGEFIAIYPDGYLRSWNLGQEESTADDVGFVNDIMTQLAQYSNVDVAQVYAIGYSNGSLFVNQLGKETSHFNAIAPMASQQNDPIGALTAPKALSVYQINGEEDELIPTSGGFSEVGHVFLSAEASARDWATQFNCNVTPTQTSQTWGTVSVTSYSFENCTSGHVVSYHVMAEIGHDVVPDSDDFFYERIWAFFKANTSGTGQSNTATPTSTPASTATSTSTPLPTSVTPDASLLTVFNQLGQGHPVSEMGWHIHDPSRLAKATDAVDAPLIVGVTGKENADGYQCGLETWVQDNTGTWQPWQCLLIDKPSWITQQIPENDGAYWAPSFLTNRIMYYSISAGFEDGTREAIGLLRAEGAYPNLRWVDSGSALIFSENPEENEDPQPTAIDPHAFVDDDGKHYLVYGGGHIWLTELNPMTGRPMDESGWSMNNPNYHHLANGSNFEVDGIPFTDGEQSWIEAPFMLKQDGYYYLFVNWYSCCNGINSTYEIRVGRSNSPTGPFVDKNGVDMRFGGGTLFLDRAGSILGNSKYIGPGHAGIYEDDNGTLNFTFHYYDGTNNGRSELGLAEIYFADGWPVVGANPTPATATPTATSTATPTSAAPPVSTATATATSLPTDVPTDVSIDVPTDVPTATVTPTATATSIPEATATPTATPLPVSETLLLSVEVDPDSLNEQGQVRPGDTVLFFIEAVNTSDTAVFDTQIVVTMPEGTTFNKNLSSEEWDLFGGRAGAMPDGTCPDGHPAGGQCILFLDRIEPDETIDGIGVGVVIDQDVASTMVRLALPVQISGSGEENGVPDMTTATETTVAIETQMDTESTPPQMLDPNNLQVFLPVINR